MYTHGKRAHLFLVTIQYKNYGVHYAIDDFELNI